MQGVRTQIERLTILRVAENPELRRPLRIARIGGGAGEFGSGIPRYASVCIVPAPAATAGQVSMAHACLREVGTDKQRSSLKHDRTAVHP